eukprot:6188852-Pleurochrysis_carterae.AAC.3
MRRASSPGKTGPSTHGPAPAARRPTGRLWLETAARAREGDTADPNPPGWGGCLAAGKEAVAPKTAPLRTPVARPAHARQLRGERAGSGGRTAGAVGSDAPHVHGATIRSPARDTSRRTDGGRDVGVVGSTDSPAPRVHGTTIRPPVWERTGAGGRGARTTAATANSVAAPAVTVAAVADGWRVRLACTSDIARAPAARVHNAHAGRHIRASAPTSARRRADTHTSAFALETTAIHTTETAQMTACARAQTAPEHMSRGKRREGMIGSGSGSHRRTQHAQCVRASTQIAR